MIQIRATIKADAVRENRFRVIIQKNAGSVWAITRYVGTIEGRDQAIEQGRRTVVTYVSRHDRTTEGYAAVGVWSEDDREYVL